MTIDDSTFQLIVRIFAIVVAVILSVVVISLGIIIIRDGNNSNVQSAFNSLIGLSQWAIGVIGSVLVIRPITNSVQRYVETRGSVFTADASVKQAQAQKLSEVPAEQAVNTIKSGA